MASRDARREAFRRIYQAYYPHVCAYARRRLNEQEADDVVAETFLVAWRRLDDVPDGEQALPWLYAVARRVVSQGLRSSRRRDRLVARLGRLGRRDDEAGADQEGLEERAVVQLALARLRPDDQEVLRLAEWEDLAPSDIARVLGCSINAASIRLHRAHKRFGEALNAVDGDLPASQREASS